MAVRTITIQKDSYTYRAQDFQMMSNSRTASEIQIIDKKSLQAFRADIDFGPMMTRAPADFVIQSAPEVYDLLQFNKIGDQQPVHMRLCIER